LLLLQLSGTKIAAATAAAPRIMRLRACALSLSSAVISS
jgi:hypothetical protein